VRLYEAVILSTLLYSADVWPLTATLTKWLNAAHHRWQRSIFGISWKDRVTNEEVRVRTGQHSLDYIDITQWKKTPLAWTCDTNGSPAHTSAGIELGGSGVQERSRSSAYKLEEHSQQGLVKDGNHLRGSRGGSSKQIRMVSKCCLMHPLGCGLNQGQGHQ